MRRAKTQGRRWTRKGTGASWAMPLSCLQLRPSPSIRVQLLSDLILRKNITLYYISRTGKKQPVRIYFLPVGAEDEAASEGRKIKKRPTNWLDALIWSGRRGSTRCRVPGKAGAFPGQAPPGLKKSGLHPDFAVEVSSSRERNKKKRLTNWLDALVWSGRRGSNSLPPPWQGGALPDELLPRQRRLL